MAGAAMLLAVPAALRAQEHAEAVISGEPTAPVSSDGQAGQADPHCAEPADASAALPPSAPLNAPLDAYVMPGTGLVFTLPDDGAEYSLPQCPPAPLRPPAPNIFGFTALPVGAGAMQAKWDARDATSFKDRRGPWDEMLGQANLLTNGNPLAMVNRWVNWHVRFEDDRAVDEWASAAVTLTRGFGDCEDFAIAKMALLEQLGIAPDDMFLVLVQDRSRPLEHAVLAVRRDGKLYVLDNRTDVLQRAEDVGDYVPKFSYSGTFSWIYGYPVGSRTGPGPHGLSAPAH